MKKFNTLDKITGLRVDVDGHFDKALRIFNKKVQNSGLIREVREREHFEKPSEKRKKAKAMAKKRWQKKVQAVELRDPNQHG